MQLLNFIKLLYIGGSIYIDIPVLLVIFALIGFIAKGILEKWGLSSWVQIAMALLALIVIIFFIQRYT